MIKVMVRPLLWLFLWVAATTAAASPRLIQSGEITTIIDGNSVVQPNGRLPYHWDLINGEKNGQLRFVANVAVDNLSEPLTIYIPRLGNTFVITVNGHELKRFGTLPPNLYDDAATGPNSFQVPTAWLSQRTTIDISIGVLGGRLGGLSAITIGLDDELRDVYTLEYFMEVTTRLVILIVTAALGALGLLLWFRLRDAGYLYYALAELLWTIVTMRPLFSEAPIPWPWWGHFYKGAFILAVPLQCKFALMVVGRNHDWPGRFNHWLLLAALPLGVLVMLVGGRWLIPFWQSVLVLDVFVLTWAVVTARHCESEDERRVLAVALIFVLVAASRDLLALSFSPELYPTLSWMRFAWTGFGISFAWIFAERLRRSGAELTALNQNLSEKLAQRSLELAEVHARERADNVEKGVRQERQRLMRDLHDGLGSHLVGVLRMAQQQTSSKQDITTQLRVAVDQLKITVDAMQDTDGDIPSLLGSVRYRLSRRLEAAGIDLEWSVGHLPIVDKWGVRQSYELQMILFEVFTNMVVHSGATHASLSARLISEPGTHGLIEIEVKDNGKGFDRAYGDQATGRGIVNMHSRAAAIGSVLSIGSKPHETCIKIVMDLSNR